jgi:3-oxoadipate CoA-transferase, alpha subunit
MASAAISFTAASSRHSRFAIGHVQHIVDLGALDPEKVATPGIYVNRVLHVPYGEPTVT